MDYEEVKIYILDAWHLMQRPLFEVGGTKMSVSNFVVALVLVFIGVKFAKFVETMVGKGLKQRKVEAGVRSSIARFIRYAVIVATLFLALDSVGFKMSSLAAFGAVLMVGVGFGLQNITQNFISGIIILIERPVKNGDIVKVGDTSGRIMDISVRSTLIQTRDDVAIIVPNSQFIAEQVVNNSFNSDMIRAHVKVGVAYGSDLDAVTKALMGVAREHKEVLDTPPASVIFENFGDSALEFDLRFWTRELWEIDRVRSEVRYLIARKFRELNIQIPFPQRDLHFINRLALEK